MESPRFRLVALLGAALLVLAVATSATAELAVILNGTAFRSGEVVEVTVAVRNAGPAFAADVYVGALRPDGKVVFLTSLSPPSGVVTTLDADPGSFPPLLTDVVVPAALEGTIPNLLSVALSDQAPRGEYSAFAALARSDALEDGRVDQGDLVASAVQSFTLVEVGTGLSTAEIEVKPASPTTSDVISIRLSGVWPNSCLPRNPQVWVTGGEVRIDAAAGAPPGTACLTVLSPWELTAVVGQLPASTYAVVVIATSEGRFLELGRKSFDVR